MQPIATFLDCWGSNTLKTNKCPGPNGLHPVVLKHCATELAPVLELVFTQSLNTGDIPADWLVANITSV